MYTLAQITTCRLELEQTKFLIRGEHCYQDRMKPFALFKMLTLTLAATSNASPMPNNATAPFSLLPRREPPPPNCSGSHKCYDSASNQVIFDIQQKIGKHLGCNTVEDCTEMMYSGAPPQAYDLYRWHANIGCYNDKEIDENRGYIYCAFWDHFKPDSDMSRGVHNEGGLLLEAWFRLQDLLDWGCGVCGIVPGMPHS